MTDEKFTLTSCCCFSLRTGSLIIAILSLILSLIGAGVGIYAGVTGISEGWLDVAIDVINIAIAAVLIHGIRMVQRTLVLAWVWGTAITVGLTIILGILVILLTSSITAAVILFVLSAVQIYFILVVRAYALSMDSAVLPRTVQETPM